MQSHIVTFSANTVGRDFAVGDIHGCFSALQKVLDTVKFDPAIDRLFSVGDLVDRGPESHLVLEWLDKPWFHAICGNHDQMAWRSALGDPYPNVDHRRHGGEWLDTLAPDTKEVMGRRLAALPLVFEVQTPNGLIGLVHASCPHDDWTLMARDCPSESDIDCYLWSIDRYRQRIDAPICNVRAVVHGHMTVSQMIVLGNSYYIDTGGWTDQGHFTLLDLNTLQPFHGPGETWMPVSSHRYR